jgi:hypothetical protein
MATSAVGSKVKYWVIEVKSCSICSGVRYDGFPPPQCNCHTVHESPNSLAAIASSWAICSRNSITISGFLDMTTLQPQYQERSSQKGILQCDGGITG